MSVCQRGRERCRIFKSWILRKMPEGTSGQSRKLSLNSRELLNRKVGPEVAAAQTRICTLGRANVPKAKAREQSALGSGQLIGLQAAQKRGSFAPC